MATVNGIKARLRALFRRRRDDDELDREVAFHLEAETARHVAAGVPPNEARRRALAAFGGVQQAREAHRAVRGLPWLEDGLSDLRLALRTLGRNRVLTGAAVLTLALGVGANTAIFSVVNAVILRPLPFHDPGRLVMVWEENIARGWYQNVVAPANYLDWKAGVSGFQDAAAYASFSNQLTLAGEGDPQLLNGVRVTGNFFSVLGVSATQGRTLRDEETWEGLPPAAVISHRAWLDHFGGRPDLVGRTVDLSGTAVEIVGIMPPSFAFPDQEVDFWVPLAWPQSNRQLASFRRAHWMRVVARLEPGVSPEQAGAQLQTVARRLQADYPELNEGMEAGLTPLQTFLVGDTRAALLVLLTAVVVLLLIACANVGNLLLVKAAGRERELAVRLALGAGRGRVVRQALTESLVLSLVGGVVGVALGWWGVGALAALQPAGMLSVTEFALDWRVLGYIFAATVLSGLLFGVAPAVWSGRRLPGEALREGGRSGSDGRRMRRWGDALVVAEVALALLLSLGAGLLVRSFWTLAQVHPGFDPRGVVAQPVILPGLRYDTAEKARLFFDQLETRVAALPGVESVGLAREVPLTVSSWTGQFIAEGRPADGFGTELVHREVSPGYFSTMRVGLVDGRYFTSQDRDGSMPVTIINDALARSYFRGQDPVGQRMAFVRAPDSSSTWYTIVGVVASEHQVSPARPAQIEAFVPIAQQPQSRLILVARARCTPGAECAPMDLAPGIREAVQGLDPALALPAPRTMSSVHADSMARERFLAILLLVFALVGLALAVIGVYGVLAQLARRRLREMGIRIALGAPGGAVRWLVVGHGLRLTLIGLLLGGSASLLITGALRGLLYGVSPTDPVTFGAVASLLVTTSLLAAWLPAQRASQADPALTLREE